MYSEKKKNIKIVSKCKKVIKAIEPNYEKLTLLKKLNRIHNFPALLCVQLMFVVAGVESHDKVALHMLRRERQQQLLNMNWEISKIERTVKGNMLIFSLCVMKEDRKA